MTLQHNVPLWLFNAKRLEDPVDVGIVALKPINAQDDIEGTQWQDLEVSVEVVPLRRPLADRYESGTPVM